MILEAKVSERQSINFLRGVPAEDALARLIPSAAEGYEKAIKRYGTDVLQYGHFTGFKRLRELIGDWHKVDMERVIVGNGGLEVISLFFKSLPLQSNLIVEEATYDRVALDAKRCGHRLIGIRLTAEGVDLDQFKDAISRNKVAAFYGIPFHQNPMAITYSARNRSAVEAICREHNVPCIWDVCYQALRYDGKENESIDVAEWGPNLASSFTKTVSPGTKCGYIIVPKDYVGYFSGVIANTRINPNLPTQAFIADFIESGKYDEFLKYLRGFYKPRMDALNSALSTHFPGVLPAPITGGFFAPLIFKNVPKDRESAFIEAAKAAGVGIAPAWDAVPVDCLEEMRKKGLFIRLTFPAFEPERIQWGIAALKETAEKFS